MTTLSQKIAGMSATRLAYLAQQLRPHRELLGAEPIAVVGMSARFPGGGQTPEEFWQLLSAGRDAIREVPPERWDIDAFHDPNPGAPGKMYVRHGAFLDDIDRFDPEFFGVNPRDAVDMDPQQRLLLEGCWWALERAGLATERLVGSRTGVYLGMMHVDYNLLGMLAGVETRTLALNNLGVAAGRISHLLGLQGPAFALDTACSSSLVAVHLACQALRDGECELALAGGANLILSPITTIVGCSNRMLAPDGRCKTFDAAADGYVRGEGCGVVALRRLVDALADGDPVLAVIRGSAVGHDGRSSGMMVPNGRAQERVIRAALAVSGLTPEQIGYVEAHGTGTALGDPIELEALGAVFARSRAGGEPLRIGSVKTNIGHAEAAAGVASLIKVILGLQHDRIPPHLNLTRPTPRARWAELGLTVPTAGAAWPRADRPRIAGVSSFGFSGTNAHLLVEEAPLDGRRARDGAPERPVHVMVLSARTAPALAELAQAHEQALADAPADAPIADLCHTVNVGRSSFEHRAWALGATAEQLRASLAELRREPARAPAAVRRALERPRPVFMYTGQGSHHPGMGAELFATQPAFRAVIERCAEVLAPRLELRLEPLLFDPQHGARLEDPRLAQPALFALALALTALWRSWGVEPAALIGHSIGEYAAACVAGVFELEDGLRLMVERGRLCHASAPGAMLAIAAAADPVEAWLRPWSSALAVAALNGPEDTVVSGEPAALAELAALLDHRGVRHRPVPVTRGYHSPLLGPILPEFRDRLAALTLASPRLPVISNLDGQPAEDRLRSPDYWCRQMREPVRFAAGLQHLIAAGHTLFLELGAAPVLCGLGRRAAGEQPRLAWLPSLRSALGETRQMLTSAAELHVRGAAVDWAAVDAPFQRRRVAAPTYPFQRARHWLAAPRPTPGAGRLERRRDRHPLLGDEIALADSPTRRFGARLDPQTPAWIGQHRVLGAALLPAAAYVELALAGLRELTDPTSAATVESLVLERPLAFADDQTHELQVLLTPDGAGAWRFEIHAREDGPRWSRLAHARLLAAPDPLTTAASGLDAATLDAAPLAPVELAPPRPAPLAPVELAPPRPATLAPAAPPRPAPLASLRARMAREVAAETYYALLHGGGLEYGPLFRAIDTLHIGDGEALVHVRLADAEILALDDYVVHPALLDGCLQAAAAALLGTDPEDGPDARPRDGRETRPWVPSELTRLRMHGRVGGSAWVHVHRCGPLADHPDALSADLTLHDDHGRLLAEIDGLLLRRRAEPRAHVGTRSAALHEWLFEIDWPKLDAPAPATAPVPGRWLLVADADDPLCPGLIAGLAARGAACTRVTPADAADHLRADPADPIAAIAVLRPAPRRRADDPELPAAARAALGDTLELLQALVRAELRAPTWLLTRDAVAVGERDALAGLADAPLWGLARAAMIEQPQLELRLLDLPLRVPEPQLPALVELLLRPPAENLLALREHGLHAARLQPSPARRAAPGAWPLRADATYLITGGLGGLGLESAELLAERGARRLTLLGRSEPRPAARERISRLRERGVAVDLVYADIADEPAMREVLAAIPDLGGVIHSAGVLDDGVLMKLERGRLDRVCRPKLDGAWLLHRLTRERRLDCFVLYSSAAALLGVGGQANYMAANTFLGALAHHRRAAGLPGLTIDWGAWTGVGMTAEPPRGRAFGGLQTIAPSKGRQVLAELLAGDRTQVGVLALTGRFDDFGDSPAHASLLRGLVAATSGGGRRQELLDELAAAAVDRRHALLAHYLGDRVATLLGLPPGRAPDPAASLAELGLDSLMVIDLKNRIGRELGVELASERLIDGTPLHQLVELLHTALELGRLRPRQAAAEEQEELLL